MVPYYTGEKRWEHKQISEFKTNEGYDILMRARAYLGDEYANAAAALTPKDLSKRTQIILY